MVGFTLLTTESPAGAELGVAIDDGRGREVRLLEAGRGAVAVEAGGMDVVGVEGEVGLGLTLFVDAVNGLALGVEGCDFKVREAFFILAVGAIPDDDLVDRMLAAEIDFPPSFFGFVCGVNDASFLVVSISISVNSALGDASVGGSALGGFPF